MAAVRIGKMSIAAVALAVIGGVLALTNECLHYFRTGAVNWGHVALALGVPALIFAIVRSAAPRGAE